MININKYQPLLTHTITNPDPIFTNAQIRHYTLNTQLNKKLNHNHTTEEIKKSIQQHNTTTHYLTITSTTIQATSQPGYVETSDATIRKLTRLIKCVVNSLENPQ